jgi:hypothetical protein
VKAAISGRAPIATSPRYYYKAFGLTIASALECPELSPAQGPAEVSIEYGQVPEALESVLEQTAWFQVNSEAFLLKVDNVAKYLVSAGKQIIIEPVPEVRDNEVRLFLLGSAFAALLQQRGLLPLHGCAVEVNGRAAIFVGPSGGGKSTLAGALHQRGYRILADDVGVISFSPAGVPFVIAAYPQIKLWADSAQLLGKNPDELRRIMDSMEKYGLPLEEGFAGTPLPLERVYELEVGSSQDLELIEVQGMDKLVVFVNHTYRRQFLAGNPGKKRHFEQCGRAARHCRVSRLRRPWDTARLPEVVELLEKDWT